MTRGCRHGAFTGEIDQTDGSVTVTCGICGDSANWARSVLQRGFVHQTAKEKFGPQSARQVTDLAMSYKALYEADVQASDKRLCAYLGTPTHLLLHFGLEVEDSRLVCLECIGGRDTHGFTPVTVDEFIATFGALEDDIARLRWFFCVVCEQGVVCIDPKTLEKALGKQ